MTWLKLNILDVHLLANRMEDKLLTNIHIPDIESYQQDNVWWNGCQYLYQDAPAHSSLAAQEFLANIGMTDILVFYLRSRKPQVKQSVGYRTCQE